MDIWHASDPSSADLRYGWLGRAADCCGQRQALDASFAISVGNNVPLALNGQSYKPVSFTDPRNYQWLGEEGEKAAFEKMNVAAKTGEQVLDFIGGIAVDARASSDRVRAAALSYRTPIVYGRAGRLGVELQNVAAMIADQLPTRLFYVSQGGYDTHQGQRARHVNLMQELNAAVTGFFKDLQRIGAADRVVLMTFSEFGRRVRENGSRGTDHGTAGPMLVMGPQVRGGVIGTHPNLADRAVSKTSPPSSTPVSSSFSAKLGRTPVGSSTPW
jgi:uncharacterized protein (DUF1501 family)